MTTVASRDAVSSYRSDQREALSSRGMLWLGLVSAIATGVLYALPRISLQALRLLDVDGYMRAQRVVDLLSGTNSWWDAWVYRANAPFGHALHWTRPVDALLATASLPFMPFTGLRQAVFLGSFVFGLLMIAAIFFAVAWAARAIVGRGASYLAGGATAFQLGLVSYNSPGHPDHHGMILLLSVLLIGHTLRLLKADSRSLSIRAGVVAALGIWVATEFLLPVAICLLALVCKWVLSGTRLQSLHVLTSSMAISLAVAVFVERHPSTRLVFEAERISALHVMMAALLATAAWGWTLATTASSATRLLLVLISGGFVAGALQWIFPGFFLGPVEAIQPSVDRFLDEYVTELAPTWHSVGREWAGMALVLGGPVIAIVQATERTWVNRKSASFAGWLLVLGWLVATFGLALVSFRYVPMAELLIGVPLVARAEESLARVRRRAIVRPLLIVWCLVGFLVLVVAASAFAGDAALTPGGNCALEQIESDLARSFLGVGEPVVLAGVPHGPELMWRLPVGVIGTPYLNPDGIEFTEAVFSTQNRERAVALLDERGVNGIVVCAGEPGSSGYLHAGSFYSSLLAGEEILGWNLLRSPGPDFRIYIRF